MPQCRKLSAIPQYSGPSKPKERGVATNRQGRYRLITVYVVKHFSVYEWTAKYAY